MSDIEENFGKKPMYIKIQYAVNGLVISCEQGGPKYVASSEDQAAQLVKDLCAELRLQEWTTGPEHVYFHERRRIGKVNES